MKLTRMLATATIFSGLSFAAAAHAAGSSKATADAEKATADAEEATSDDDSGSSTTSTTINTSDDQSAGTPATDSTDTTPSGTATGAATGTTGTSPTDSADPAVGTTPAPDSTDSGDGAPAPVVVEPAQPVQPVAVPVVPATTTNGRSVVFLPTVSASDRAQYGYSPPIGVAIMAGGGAFDFVGGDIRAATKMGGFWQVRALLGSRSIVGLEAAYLGTAQSIQALGLASDARLLSNGVEGTLRLNAPIGIRRLLIEPFAFGGGGWSHYNIVNSNTSTASLRDTDNVITVPVGGGLDMGFNGFFLDARFTYRFSYNNDLVQAGDRGLNNWNAGGAIGYEF
jgi:hypothetical protein